MTDQKPIDKTKAQNRKILFSCVFVVGAMVGLAYASVPLYKLFCQVTGFGGTTQVATEAPVEVSEKTIKVRFNADVNSGLNWQFKPEQREITVRLGEDNLAYYMAENMSVQPITGQAVYNVTPLKAGQYFNKIACFCFDEQTLEPGQRVDMPVSFYVDPAIAEDINTQDVKTITLSYTFFKAEASVEAADGNEDQGG
ncbi:MULTISPECIES: cytochrome c oxidase assembly protein [Thalassospira]|jgi:cytochrome c oxidase assembly protein subunit 11|uniref:Cytochrome c oxidase assembly protein CtaG n=1 Tax=Thalassospira povalilytica TaxID=732237 RepID=A0ABX4RDA3_9PROT|nr:MULTISPECIES: cytochrome c oxidase assembly protein [Thalassospira]MAL40928.1 cytochrome c oxidase assembly protein [Thalassospira sp.]MBO6769882.1 cytochrome c oxidase assembly protein [Thalassospira sp.]MCC4239416.1 cytochrome c oxidase assembly protein [Thalassospira povalilytica]PKR52237.1 cytochrome c oxidase assembly protein [Thalassospira povalilytica]URK17205.1 cytochrome c oxidase assembly protein [Thalassospira sp. GO-4]|tara:strand:+ start:2106 stop:2696 length:591 start_codon:yes stop_codon:yes gene_type:complete|eukprot:TRINITY_DN1041_c0_g2_i4.p2 TRINITY_DN1041_c0_g2~~TRINITY_DN1041_c0_g2_i4.p2  ORF type:complete len:197 (-),score=43.27 TRINITY_DN1041_c0_g2_i4:901-1491(-)